MIPCLYEPFKHWAFAGSVWILSDPHFDDADCKLMNPNWVSAEEQIAIINSKVFKHDTLICLGDCGNLDRFKELKCQNLILIKGNHDDKGNSKYTPYFREVYDGPLFIADKILLSHEPIYGLSFCLNIHGHKHNGQYAYEDNGGAKHLNLAADVCGYTPINLGKLIKSGGVAGIDGIHRQTIDNAIVYGIDGKLKSDIL